MSSAVKVTNDDELPQLEAGLNSSSIESAKKKKMAVLAVVGVTVCAGVAAAVGLAVSGSNSVGDLGTSTAETSIELFTGQKSANFINYDMGRSVDAGVLLDDTGREFDLTNIGLDGIKCAGQYCNDMSPIIFNKYQPFMGYVPQGTYMLADGELESFRCPTFQYVSQIRCAEVNSNKRCEAIEAKCSYVFGSAEGFDFKYGSVTDYSKEFCSQWGNNYVAAGLKRVASGDDPIDSVRVACLPVTYNGKNYKAVNVGTASATNELLQNIRGTYVRSWGKGFDSIGCTSGLCLDINPYIFNGRTGVFSGRWKSEQNVGRNNPQQCGRNEYVSGMVCHQVANNDQCDIFNVECASLELARDGKTYNYAVITDYSKKKCSEWGTGYVVNGVMAKTNGFLQEMFVSCVQVRVEE